MVALQFFFLDSACTKGKNTLCFCLRQYGALFYLRCIWSVHPRLGHMQLLSSFFRRYTSAHASLYSRAHGVSISL